MKLIALFSLGLALASTPAFAKTVRCFPVRGLGPDMTVDLSAGRIRKLNDVVYGTSGAAADSRLVEYRLGIQEAGKQNGVNKIQSAAYSPNDTYGVYYILSIPESAFSESRPGIAPVFRASLQINLLKSTNRLEVQCEPARID